MQYLCNRRLCGWSLAIVQAASYIRDKECSISEYIDMYETTSTPEEISELLPEVAEPLKHIRDKTTVFKTWKTSFDRLSGTTK